MIIWLIKIDESAFRKKEYKMNTVNLTGRFTQESSVSYNGDKVSLRNTLAVDRGDKERTADFISIVAFGKTAEFIEKYFHKGMKIGIEGRIRTGSYTNKDGQKVYTTSVVVERCEFLEKKEETSEAPEASQEGFVSVPDGIDEELPFN